MTKHPPLGLELAAIALVPAACFAFNGVFETTDATWDIIAAAAGSSVLAAILRRLGIPLILASALSLVGLAMVLTAQFGLGTGFYGVFPNAETLEVGRDLIDEGQEQFQQLRAPVPATPAFSALAMIGAWVMAMLTDWGAMRLRLSFEPVLPGGLLFAFASILGVASGELGATLVFAAAVVIWATLQRVARLRDRETWLSSDIKRGPAAVALPALGLGTLALIGGLAAGPLLPGAQDSELFYWRNGGEPTRFVVSPFVKIDNRLVEQRDIDLFTVESEQPAYWRIVGLDTFDDGYWRTRGEFTNEDGRLPGLTPRAGSTITIEQTFNIQALAEIWLPAAFAPSDITSDQPVKWNADTGSLSTSGDTSDGLTYTVSSVVGLFTPAELAAAQTTMPSNEFSNRYLDLPSDLTLRLASEARLITEGAGNRYEQAKMLQDYFRQFEYSVNLSPRRGDPIEQFLDERVGFCQQFSGTMALMARSLGIPARVAVGFTWGDPISGQPNTYQITGRHTHAWPELWFGELGWVAFEPTPGRGSPTGANYTEVAATQDSTVEPESPNTSSPTTEANSSTSLPDSQNQVPLEPEFGVGTAPVNNDFNLPWRRLAVVFIAAAYLGGVPAMNRYRRARRINRAQSNAARVGASWIAAVEDLEFGFGLVRRRGETRSEFATRCIASRGVPKELTSLGEIASNARYGPSTITAADVRNASAVARMCHDAMRSKLSRSQRYAKALNPKRVWSQLTSKSVASSEDWTIAA